MWFPKLYILNSNCHFLMPSCITSSKPMFCSNGRKFFFIVDCDQPIPFGVAKWSPYWFKMTNLSLGHIRTYHKYKSGGTFSGHLVVHLDQDRSTICSEEEPPVALFSFAPSKWRHQISIGGMWHSGSRRISTGYFRCSEWKNLTALRKHITTEKTVSHFCNINWNSY